MNSLDDATSRHSRWRHFLSIVYFFLGVDAFSPYLSTPPPPPPLYLMNALFLIDQSESTSFD